MPGKTNINKKELPEKRTTITLNLSPENKKAIKMFAVENDTTISALVNKWIEKECKKDGGK